MNMSLWDRLFKKSPPRIIAHILPAQESLEFFSPLTLKQSADAEAIRELEKISLEQLCLFFYRGGVLGKILSINREEDPRIETAIIYLNKLVIRINAKLGVQSSKDVPYIPPFVLYKRADVGFRPFDYDTEDEIRREISKVDKSETKLGLEGTAHKYNPLLLGCEIRYRYAPQQVISINEFFFRLIYPDFRPIEVDKQPKKVK